MRAVALLLLAAACSALPPKAPAPAAPAVRLPASRDFTLANGLRVILVPDPKVPLVSLQARIAGGSLEDPSGKEGCAGLLAALLAKGAGERDALAFHEAVDFVGGEFSASAALRWMSIRAEFLSADTDLALELFSDALLRPRLDPAEFEKERGQAVDAIRAAREEPESLIRTYYNRWLLAAHPFGRPESGDEQSLASVTIDDVRALAARALAPKRAWIAVAGAFDPAEMRRKLEGRFGSWKGGAEPPPAGGAPTAAASSRVLLVDKPDSLQTYFRFGNLSIDWSHPEYPQRYLANTILGGLFTSRLNTALRIRSGLTYGAGSGFDEGRRGLFAVSSYTETDKSRQALELARSVYREFVEKGITQEELDGARSYVKGQYAPGTVETAAQAAAMILALDFDGISRDRVNHLFADLDAATLESVNATIRDRFPRDALVWTVIGQASKLRPFLAEFGPVTEVSITLPGFGPAGG